MSARIALFILAAAFTADASGRTAPEGIIPDSCGSWHAVSATATYTTKTIFDYLDGGAEIYLAYGMTKALARRFESTGRPAIEASVFTMKDPGGAFGVFTYERMDEDAGIGQGSEYGAGILRFWQGRSFVFLQAESETPDVHSALLALGTMIAAHLDPPAPLPELATILPQGSLRPRAVRYTLTPTVLQNLEPTLAGDRPGFPPNTPAILGRYGAPQDRSRIIVAALGDDTTAARCADLYRTTFCGATPDRGGPGSIDPARSRVAAVNNHLVLILDMPDAATAQRHLNELTDSLRRIHP
jgi:hypothetical protein